MEEVKQCTKCGATKSLEEFAKRGNPDLNKRRANCRECGNTYWKAYHRKLDKNLRLAYYRRNKVLVSKKRKERYADKKWRLINECGGKCAICGYKRCAAALDFHHLNPHNKEFSISGALINGSDYNAILIEAKKCTVLCANCHREIHSGFSQLSNN